jgi:2,3-bisphosphoglycerate-independent phosphoglycerate mutase
MKQLLKYGINVLDKENVTQDQIEYVYKKWGRSVAERLVEMLEDETKRAREVLERLKISEKKRKQRKKRRAKSWK